MQIYIHCITILGQLFCVLALCSDQNDGTQKCHFSRPAKHGAQICHLCSQVCSLVRANSRAVNPYVPSFSKKLTGFPSHLIKWAFQRDCCDVQSLCNSLCARTGGYFTAVEYLTHRYQNCPRVPLKRSTAFICSGRTSTTLFQTWSILFHWFDSSGRRVQRRHADTAWSMIYTGLTEFWAV